MLRKHLLVLERRFGYKDLNNVVQIRSTLLKRPTVPILRITVTDSSCLVFKYQRLHERLKG